MFQEVKFTVLSPTKQSFKLFEFFSIGGIKKTCKCFKFKLFYNFYVIFSKIFESYFFNAESYKY